MDRIEKLARFVFDLDEAEKMHLSLAALIIAQHLGAKQSFEDGDLEFVADTINRTLHHADIPCLDGEESRAFWEDMGDDPHDHHVQMTPAAHLKEGMIVDIEHVLDYYDSTGVKYDSATRIVAQDECAVVIAPSEETVHKDTLEPTVVLHTDQGSWGVPRDLEVGVHGQIEQGEG